MLKPMQNLPPQMQQQQIQWMTLWWCLHWPFLFSLHQKKLCWHQICRNNVSMCSPDALDQPTHRYMYVLLPTLCLCYVETLWTLLNPHLWATISYKNQLEIWQRIISLVKEAKVKFKSETNTLVDNNTQFSMCCEVVVSCTGLKVWDFLFIGLSYAK